MSDSRLCRRQFILAATAVVGASLAARLPGSFVEDDLLQRVLRALGQENAPVAAVAGIEDCVTSILGSPAACSESTEDLKHIIRRNIEADYLAGSIRVVNGWWLSRTEAECLELIGKVVG